MEIRKITQLCYVLCMRAATTANAGNTPRRTFVNLSAVMHSLHREKCICREPVTGIFRVDRADPAALVQCLQTLQPSATSLRLATELCAERTYPRPIA